MKAVLCPLCRRKIKLRTKKALQKLKVQGVKLGANNPAVLKGLKKVWAKQKANRLIKIKEKKQKEKNEKFILSLIKSLRKKGLTLNEITLYLNKKKITTKHGCKYHLTTVYRLLQKHHVS